MVSLEKLAAKKKERGSGGGGGGGARSQVGKIKGSYIRTKVPNWGCCG